MAQIGIDNIKAAIENIPDDILRRYDDNIWFGSYPVVRGRLYDVLLVKDGTERILLAVHCGSGFVYWTENEEHPFVRDFFERMDWKQFWCLS